LISNVKQDFIYEIEFSTDSFLLSDEKSDLINNSSNKSSNKELHKELQTFDLRKKVVEYGLRNVVVRCLDVRPTTGAGEYSKRG
jgi:hypothetical protein